MAFYIPFGHVVNLFVAIFFYFAFFLKKSMDKLFILWNMYFQPIFPLFLNQQLEVKKNPYYTILHAPSQNVNRWKGKDASKAKHLLNV
jgi:hypothetical protein